MWVFGYGSLIWKVGFDFEERREGFVDGWTRRFWQESTDHRGTPEAPGRVVTLVPEGGSLCWGAAYRIAPDTVEDVLAQLDHREKGGYARHRVAVHDRHGLVTDDALMYVGTPDNPSWGGPLPIQTIAEIIAEAHGPSGANLEYVIRLHESLVAMGATDEHVAALHDELVATAFVDR